MACPVVALEAQQTAPRPFRQMFRLDQRLLGFGGFHVRLEDRHHPLWMPGAHGVAPRLGRAEALQSTYPIPAASSPEASWRFEKPGFRDAATARTSSNRLTPASFNAASTPSIVQPS